MAKAKQWLLRSYAKDGYIQDLVRDLQSLRQSNGQTEPSFGHRVRLNFARLGGVYSQEEQIASFIKGLLPSTASCVTRDRQLHRDRFTTLDAVVELTMSHGHTSRLTRPPRHPLSSKSYQPKTSVISIEGTTLSTDTAPTACRSRNGAVLHIETDDDGPPTDPSYSCCTTEAETLPWSDLLGQSDPALPIVLNYNPRLEKSAQPKRVGWVDRKFQRSPNASRRDVYGACFLCADPDHVVVYCEWITLVMRAKARQRIMEASSEAAARMQAMVYYVAWLTPHKREYHVPRQSAAPAH